MSDIDPEIWVTLDLAVKRDIRELRRLIRAAEKDKTDPRLLHDLLGKAKRAEEFLSAV